ncbi:MAG: DUF4860 domain-containing protein [Lachnospiraceae bacterium]|nr:DUF4860 domain-containing protein [Lachnospiraceae bacterium]
MYRLHSEKKHSADFPFILTLLGVFTISALLVTLFGANIYRHIVSESQTGYEKSASLSYMREKLRQNDRAGAISLIEVDGTDVLSIEADFPDNSFVTWIYFQDGALKELFCKKDNPISLSAGQALLTLSDFSMAQLSDSSFLFCATAKDGSFQELTVTLHTAAD